MTVNVSKPALNVREKLAELDKPTGIAGEAMLRAETPQEQQALIGVGRRNLIINGAMQVAQRGTSFTANGYGIDRYTTYNSGGFATLTQENLAAGDSLANGSIHHYMRVVRTSPSGIYYISNKIENVKTASGETVTFSFYAKASASVSLGVRLTQDFGSGGSSTFNTAQQSVGLTTSWSRYTMSFSLPSVSGKTIGTNNNLAATFDIPSSTVTFDITGVQLEVGKVATPFEHRSYGEELALCQRYYYRLNRVGSVVSPVGTGAGVTSTRAIVQMDFPVTMRVNPTSVAVSGTASHYSIRAGALDISCNAVPTIHDSATLNGIMINFYVGGGISAGYACTGCLLDSSAYIAVEAEL